MIFKFFFPCILFVFWILLNEECSKNSSILGALISIWLYYASSKFRFKYLTKLKFKKLFLLPKIILYMSYDILRSSFGLVRLIINLNSSMMNEFRCGFVSIPIEIRNPFGLMFLCCIISYIPGTIWIGLSDQYILTLHVLNLSEEKKIVHIIKEKYEVPLMEIFE